MRCARIDVMVAKSCAIAKGLETNHNSPNWIVTCLRLIRSICYSPALPVLACSVHILSLCRAKIRWRPFSAGDEICRCRQSRNRRKHIFRAGSQRQMDWAWYRIWDWLRATHSFHLFQTFSGIFSQPLNWICGSYLGSWRAGTAEDCHNNLELLGTEQSATCFRLLPYWMSLFFFSRVARIFMRLRVKRQAKVLYGRLGCWISSFKNLPWGCLARHTDATRDLWLFTLALSS